MSKVATEFKVGDLVTWTAVKYSSNSVSLTTKTGRIVEVTSHPAYCKVRQIGKLQCFFYIETEKLTRKGNPSALTRAILSGVTSPRNT